MKKNNPLKYFIYLKGRAVPLMVVADTLVEEPEGWMAFKLGDDPLAEFNLDNICGWTITKVE